jgi:acyl-CoA dehydrogenase
LRQLIDDAGGILSRSASLVAETAERIFADLADPQTVTVARDDCWKKNLWRVLEENGLTRAWISEDLGGYGMSLAEGFDVALSVGRFAVGVPLVETMLAGWLLSIGGVEPPVGRMTVAPTQPLDRIMISETGTISGRARDVPFANDVDYVVVLACGTTTASVALVAAGDCVRMEGTNLAGDSRSAVAFENVKPRNVGSVPVGFDQNRLLAMGCVVRCLQIAGALQSVLDRTVTYAGERVAFGRPIAKFQAVQQNLARLAGEVAAALAAATSAADALSNAEDLSDGMLLEVAAAKIRCADAASMAAAIAHQIHGAIGLTREHVLHRFTLRALSWRDDFGHENHWAVELGNFIAARGADQLWPLVASR